MIANASAYDQAKVTALRTPIVAVRPFTGDGLGFALADDLARHLARAARYRVICRLAARTLADYADAAFAEAVDADWIIAGAIAGTALNAYLFERARGAVVWRDSASLADPWAPIDRIAASATLVIGKPNALGAIERGRLRRETSPGAIAAYREALVALTGATAESHRATRETLARAINASPRFAAAHGLLGFVIARDFRRGWSGTKAEADAGARQHMDAALASDADDPTALWTAAFVDAMLLRRYGEAHDLIRRSLAIEPGQAHALSWGGMFASYAWEFDQAIAYAAEAARASPFGPLVETHGFAGALGAYHGRRFELVPPFADRANAANPKLVNTMRLKAAALVRLGRLDEARAVMARVMALAPEETIAKSNALNPLREWPGFAHFAEALRLAGMPE
jgi:tetratricopeptide (TPR) repeat protein